jgi:hypothetical protein
VRFLELSGVRRMMDDETDEDEAQAERMGEWIAWKTQERVM